MATSPADRSWDIAILTASEPGRRNRRTVDSLLLALAAVAIGLSAAIGSAAPQHDQGTADALVTLLGWADALWRAAFLGLVGLAAVIIVDVLLRRRWGLVRDLLVAVLGVMAAASVLGRLVESTENACSRHHPE